MASANGQIAWLDADGQVEDTQYVTLEQFEKEGIKRGAAMPWCAITIRIKAIYGRPTRFIVVGKYFGPRSPRQPAKARQCYGRSPVATGAGASAASGAKVIQFPLFPNHRSVSNDSGALGAVFLYPGEGSAFHQGRAAGRLLTVWRSVLRRATESGRTRFIDGRWSFWRGLLRSRNG